MSFLKNIALITFGIVWALFWAFGSNNIRK
jgi:hypothetical protein